MYYVTRALVGGMLLALFVCLLYGSYWLDTKRDMNILSAALVRAAGLAWITILFLGCFNLGRWILG
jgi:hypothetical protein